MIADPHEGPRTCAQCEREGRCPTPQACERAEQDRIDRAAWRDFRIAAVLIAVLAVVILVLNWR